MTTKRQSDLLAFLKQEFAQGRSPTFKEIAEAIGEKSEAGVHRLVDGLIRQFSSRARAIEVVDRSEYARGYQAGYADAMKKFGAETRAQ